MATNCGATNKYGIPILEAFAQIQLTTLDMDNHGVRDVLEIEFIHGLWILTKNQDLRGQKKYMGTMPLSDAIAKFCKCSGFEMSNINMFELPEGQTQLTEYDKPLESYPPYKVLYLTVDSLMANPAILLHCDITIS